MPAKTFESHSSDPIRLVFTGFLLFSNVPYNMLYGTTFWREFEILIWSGRPSKILQVHRNFNLRFTSESCSKFTRVLIPLILRYFIHHLLVPHVTMTIGGSDPFVVPPDR